MKKLKIVSIKNKSVAGNDKVATFESIVQINKNTINLTTKTGAYKKGSQKIIQRDNNFFKNLVAEFGFCAAVLNYKKLIKLIEKDVKKASYNYAVELSSSYNSPEYGAMALTEPDILSY